ncbi:MAG: bifunctional 4-hydroxy-2-oxoglutarate aldolase/2-dehydro-3-deoxy-phosphogluconate aldolase [Opitutales bacterium]
MIERLLAKRIVPVVVLADAEDAEPLAEALLEAGLDVIELTFRTAAAEESIHRIATRYTDMLIGAGTLLSEEQVKRAHGAGAVFGLAPGLNPGIVATAKEIGLQFSPGVMTPSEVEQALSLDCKLLKFFPAEAAGGIKMLKSLAGPYAHTGVQFTPTGGITAKNLQDYLNLPVVAAIGGSWMVSPALIKEKNWSKITRLTKEALKLAKL